MENEIHQASESTCNETTEAEFPAIETSTPDYFSGRDFGDEDAHDLFEV